MTFTEIQSCRICGNRELSQVVHLGIQHLTGVFPRSRLQHVTSGPLELVKCDEISGNRACGLLQLRQTYDLRELYGDNYGYRSGLNASMVRHLGGIVDYIQGRVSLSPGDIVVDIGSNDATLLKAYPAQHLMLIGIDPTGNKFREYYPKHIYLIADFFSAASFKATHGTKKAKVVTSIAMFYDLANPLAFMEQVRDILADDGIWVFEQSYMPTMLEMNAYDTICHEHLEYYRLKQIKWMTDRAGFDIIDVQFNDTNGGSVLVTASKSGSGEKRSAAILKPLRDEELRGLGTLAPYQSFRDRILRHRDELLSLLRTIRDEGHVVAGYGASTKGNVVLQFCGLTEREIPFFAEVNKDKLGAYTPGTRIPIIDEEEARRRHPDYFLVMPWHFRKFIIEKEQRFLQAGGRLIFPLPVPEIVGN